MTSTTALDALEADLLDALDAIQRARRHLEGAQGRSANSPRRAPGPGEGPSGSAARVHPAAVRYKLKPDALAALEAALAGRRSVRG